MIACNFADANMTSPCFCALWLTTLFCPLKFAVQLNRLAVWHNESELYDMLVRVNHGEHHAFQQSALRAAGDIEETELDRLSIRRHLSLPANPISGVTIMGCEQTIPLDVEHCDLMVRRPFLRVPFVQNSGTTGCGANCKVDRDAHNRAVPGACQGLHFFKRLLCVGLWDRRFRRRNLLRQRDGGRRNKDDD